MNSTAIVILVLLVLQTSGEDSVDFFCLFTFTNCDEALKEDCSNALLNEERMLTHNVQIEYSEKVRFCFIDVQNSQENLIQFLLPLVDGKEYYVKCRNNQTYIPNFERLFIMTYISFELTRLASFLVLPLGYPLFGVTREEIYPAYYLDHELGLFSYQSSFGAEMHRHGFIKLKNELKVSYGAIVNVFEDANSGLRKIKACGIGDQDSSAWCLYASECPNDCFKEININLSNQKDVDQKLELIRKENMSFIILSCQSAFVSRFLKEFSLSESIYFLPFSRRTANETTETVLEMTSYYNTDVMVYFPGTFAFNSLMYYLVNMTGLMMYSESIWDGIMDDKQVQAFIQTKIPCQVIQTIFPTYQCNDHFTYQMWLKVPESFKKMLVNQMVKTKTVLKSMCLFFKLRFYMQAIDYKHLTNQYMFNPAKGLKLEPFCELKKPTCRAGQHLVHSLYKEPNWDRSRGWNCQLCPESYYKTIGNNEPCIKCGYPLKTNQNHTQCFDPYRLKILRYTDPLIIGLTIISGVIFVFILFTALLFLVKRNTPIVLSSNRQMTILQLTMHLILTVVPLYLYIDEVKTDQKCVLRQLIIGMSFTVTISVNISKTQKLFMIVQRKIIMSRSEILLTKASEWVIIIVMLLFNISIHLAKLFYYSFQVSTKYHDLKLIKEHYCSNERLTFLQIIFAGGLIVINGIQGMRGRKLPSQFRETNHVIYSSFISLVLIVSMVGIFLSRKFQTDREIVVLIATVLLNSVHFLLLYCYKVYIILFKPHLNSRDFANRRRLNQMMKAMKNKPQGNGSKKISL
ncbi:uncharacterized protein [Clytia hemisphaerica]|uniref:uncharacterized protein n=1 Tax=Clytia hemisphaerica TaxID=252671 RepID=UPI0034D5A522